MISTLLKFFLRRHFENVKSKVFFLKVMMIWNCLRMEVRFSIAIGIYPNPKTVVVFLQQLKQV